MSSWAAAGSFDRRVNYFNYFTEIEQFYQTKRDVFTLLTTLDWVLIENWKDQGVPLDVVLKGIERAFARPNAKRKINSLAYCIKAVEQVIEEQKDAQVEKPEMPEISQDETRRYLADLAEKTNAVAKVFPEFAGKIGAVAESVRVVETRNFRDAEQVLSALEEKLIAILRVAAEESALIDVKREVEGELAPFRSTMTAQQLAMLEEQLSRRKLLERFNVPRLSLFYLM
jgi:ribosomal protein L16 Arg81 hydroxylase